MVACLAIALASLTWKLATFSDVELRVDQASHARLVQSLRRAERVWPAGGGNILERLASDDGSFLHHVALAPYNDGFNLLNVVAIAGFYLLSFPFGDSVTGFNAASIVFNWLTLMPLALWLHAATARDSELRRGLALLVLTVGFCGAHYLFYFSPLGLHNVAALAWLLALFAARRLVLAGRPASRRDWATLFAWHATAIYCYTTVFFMLVPATLLFFMQAAVPRGPRLRLAAIYLAGVFVITLPVMVLRFANPSSLTANIPIVDVARVSTDTVAAVRSSVLTGVQWFGDGVMLFSLPGLILGLAGAVLCYRREPFLLLALAAHLMAYALVPAFADAALRTDMYALPLLILGSALACGCLDFSRNRRRLVASVVGAGLFVAHLALQGYLITNREAFAARNPQFSFDHLEGQGRLLPAFGYINGLTGSAPLFFWSYPVRDLFQSAVQAPVGRGYPAIENLLTRAEGEGEEFRAYLRMRGVDPAALTGGFLLAGEDISSAQVTRAIDTIRQRAGGHSAEVQAELVYAATGVASAAPSLKLFRLGTQSAEPRER